MTNALKKIYIAITSMLMVVTLQAHGDEFYPSNNRCEPVCCDTQCLIQVRGELLVWRPELCGLEAAFGNTEIATTVSPSAIITTTVTESDKEPDFEWNAGFRVGASVISDAFIVDMDWTHFRGRAKFHEHGQHGHWKIRYDVVDLTLGHRFCITPCFYLKPFIGIRGAQIHHKLKSHLETLFTAVIGNNIVTTDLDDTEDFRGVGPELGICADWYVGCNFSLYGSFDVVTYYGDVKGKNFDTNTFTQTVSAANGRRKHCFSNIGTDFALGVRWDATSNYFCGCDMNFMLKAGLEQHRIYDFSNLGADGTLSFDGGVFAAGVSFQY